MIGRSYDLRILGVITVGVFIASSIIAHELGVMIEHMNNELVIIFSSLGRLP